MEIRNILYCYCFEVFEISHFFVMGLISLNRNKGEYNTMLLIVFLRFVSLRAKVIQKMQGREGEETYLEEK